MGDLLRWRHGWREFFRPKVRCRNDDEVYQTFRTPHLNTSDLRCFISSSGPELVDFEAAFDFDVALAECFGSLVDVFRDFVVGGVESFSTDISESLSSSAICFCFFFCGDSDKSIDSLLFDFISFSGWGDASLAGDLTFGFTGEDSGVAWITAFFRRIFLATQLVKHPKIIYEQSLPHQWFLPVLFDFR